MALTSLLCLALAGATRVSGSLLGFEPGPPPLLEESEYLRPSLELVSSIGAGVPEGRRGHDGALPAGGELALVGLYRATPYFAVGAGLRLNTFPLLPASGDGGSARSAQAIGRLYFQERGAQDPYFELGLGVTSLETTRGTGALRTRQDELARQQDKRRTKSATKAFNRFKPRG